MRYRWFEKDVPLNALGFPMTRAERDEADRARAAKKGLGRGEAIAIATGFVIFFYGIYASDRAMALMAAAFLIHELRLLAPFLPPACRQPACNIVRGFSLALFGGTLLLTFL